jgi:hypothetical protein
MMKLLSSGDGPRIKTMALSCRKIEQKRACRCSIVTFGVNERTSNSRSSRSPLVQRHYYSHGLSNDCHIGIIVGLVLLNRFSGCFSQLVVRRKRGEILIFREREKWKNPRCKSHTVKKDC